MCRFCETAYHGYRCSEIFMARNYEGSLVCLKCFSSGIPQEFDQSKKERVEASLWNKQTSIYKDLSREKHELTEITDSQKGQFLGQVGDECYLLWQGYEESVKRHPYHFLCFENRFQTPLTVIDEFLQSKFKEAVKC